jgi:hypothetical protein
VAVENDDRAVVLEHAGAGSDLVDSLGGVELREEGHGLAGHEAWRVAAHGNRDVRPGGMVSLPYVSFTTDDSRRPTRSHVRRIEVRR